MDFASYLDEIRTQADALRASAVTAGPDADVPTCAGWTVQRLVRHIARVHNWVSSALRTDPTGEPAPAEQPPEGWDELLPWWDEQVDAMLDALRDTGSDVPVWTFLKNGTSGFWARRQAHETAIHRLDAEHAVTGTTLADPSLVFEPDFAADGIDEALTLMVPRKLAREEPPNRSGTVLFHAADAGRAWLVTLTPGQVPAVGPAVEPAIDTDASVVGTADAVYRACWHRPSTAVRGGDHSLIDLLRTP